MQKTKTPVVLCEFNDLMQQYRTLQIINCITRAYPHESSVIDEDDELWGKVSRLYVTDQRLLTAINELYEVYDIDWALSCNDFWKWCRMYITFNWETNERWRVSDIILNYAENRKEAKDTFLANNTKLFEEYINICLEWLDIHPLPSETVIAIITQD